MKGRYLSSTLALLCLTLFTNCNKPAKPWTPLLDKNLSQWDIFLGIPHKTSGIPGYEHVENVNGGYPPLGLGNKKNVFSTFETHGEVVLKVTGEIYGALISKAIFENYHLYFKVKWGEKRWPPRLNATRNNGLLYHSVGEFGGGLWNTWMSSLEFEVEETNFGDFICIDEPNVTAYCPAIQKANGKYYFYPNAPLKRLNWKTEDTGRCFKNEDHEKPFGEWNTVELIAFGNTNIHIVNGKVVNVVYNPQYYNGNSWEPMLKGKLQFQSEAAETYFKDIKIKSITHLEKPYKIYLK